ncbi:hypothetical protein GF354_06295 [Candidatus Peregrinibacteria bacterium]|nr:hypothetical protein [Candidatus Peregrinibacteria bacterium]
MSKQLDHNLVPSEIVQELWDMEENIDKINGSTERLMRLYELGDREAMEKIKPEVLRNGFRREVFELFRRCYKKNSEINANDIFGVWALNEYASEIPARQYQENLRTLKLYKLYDPDNPKEGDVTAPTLEQCQEILINTLTKEQLEVIMKMEKPTFQLIPITGMNRYIEAINSYKPIPDQKNFSFFGWAKERAFIVADGLEGMDEKNNGSIKNWRLSITEGAGAPGILEGENLNDTILDRCEWFQDKYQDIGVKGIDYKSYLLLIMKSLAKDFPEPIDNLSEIQENTWTIVTNIFTNYTDGITGGFWMSTPQPGISFQDKNFNFTAIEVMGRARFRTTIRINVPT